jgi:hypothetical protein
MTFLDKISEVSAKGAKQKVSLWLRKIGLLLVSIADALRPGDPTKRWR